MLSHHFRAPSRVVAACAMAVTLLAGCEELIPIGSGSGTSDAAAQDGAASQEAGGGSVGDGSIAPCECTGPRPLAPNEQCADGSIAGPVCAQHGDGTCSWEIRSCPLDGCPALGCNPMCPNGVREDENGCPSCQCAGETVDPCAGLSCGDGCTTCGTGGPCLGIAQFCDAKGTCAAATPTCPAPSGLHWYATCGDPVCGLPARDPTLPSCGSIEAGDPCTEPSAECDPGVGCGGKLRCTDEPIDTNNCPISSRRYKTGIDYLGASDLEQLARTLQSIKLATYHYKQQAPAEQKHLGFIIEDAPGSPAVFMDRDRVDLYGYASMAVAALQVQEGKIQALERELAALRARLPAADQAGMCRPTAP
jgi:hypothetical protein